MDIIVRNIRTYNGPGEYIDRRSPLGNPFKMHKPEDRDDVIKQYRVWLSRQLSGAEDIELNQRVLDELKRLLHIAQNKQLNLICWCAPKACHGDVIKACLEWMDN